MSTVCDTVAERIALGEPLAELDEHAASCERCCALVDLPARLGAARTPIDPGLGFSARMTAGAQHRIAVRHRRRVAATVATGLGATLALVFVVTRAPAAEPHMAALAFPKLHIPTRDPQPDPTPEPPRDPKADEEDLAALVRFADVDRARHYSARWTRIERPLRPYRHLVSRLKGDQ